MSTTSEKNQFRRLIGDFAKNNVTDLEIESWLDDATREVTSDFTVTDGNALVPAVITDFDLLVVQYHPEVIVYAAINWWWDYASKHAEKETVAMGDASSDPSTRWDRAMQMIERLQTRYDVIQSLGTDISIGNLSHFSKITLTRLGGNREETYLEE